MKVFVGSLNYETTRTELESLFSEVGHVLDVFIPNDRDTGRPRGFAFVQFEDKEAAAAAIQKFDGYELRGRSLQVNEAQERPSRSRTFTNSGSPGRNQGFKQSKPKGSRKNLRSKIRSL